MKLIFHPHHTVRGATANAETGVHTFTFHSLAGMIAWKYDNRSALIETSYTTSTGPTLAVQVIEQGAVEQQNPKEFVLDAINERFNKAYATGKQEVSEAMEELRQYLIRWMPVIVATLFLPQIAYSALAGVRIERLDTRGNATIHRIDRFRF